MIQIIPSIIIKEGKVIRLQRGDLSKEKVYDESPVDLARQFEDHGIEVLHLVDLDGSQRGSPVNYHILQTIAGYTHLKVDFTGGIHTDGDISKAYEYGAKYITAASVSVSRRSLFSDWIISYGREKITLGADHRNKRIAVRGWQKDTNIDLFEHIEYFYNRGLKYAKVTDIDRDGTMVGPNFELYQALMERFPDLCILASGGVRNIGDIQRLNDMGMFAIIFGKAYYEGKIKLSELDRFLVKES